MCPSAQEKPHCPLWCSLRSYAASHFQHCRCVCESEAYMDAQEENSDPVFYGGASLVAQMMKNLHKTQV